MTRKERVRQALTHHDTDIVPYNVYLTRVAYQRLMDYVKDPEYVDAMGDHFSGTGFGGFEEIKPAYFQDDFGVVWNRTVDKDIGVLEGLVLPEPDLSQYSFPVIDEAKLRARCKQAIDNAGDTFVVASLGFSVFERAWTLRGMENVLIDFVTDKRFSHELFDAICEFNLNVIRVFCEFPFDAIYFGDDWGQQSGTIMGPGHWREFIKPAVARMYAMAKHSGKFVIQHSCGDIQELFRDLIDIGLDAYNTFQPEIYDIRAVKREFGDNLSFYGGISTQRLLPFAKPEEVKRVTREIMSIMSVGGGYIASPTHAVPGDIPPENIVAMVEVFKQQ